MTHSHEHTHRPPGPDAIARHLLVITLIDQLVWQRTGRSSWQATHTGLHLILDQGLLIMDEHGRVLIDIDPGYVVDLERALASGDRSSMDDLDEQRTARLEQLIAPAAQALGEPDDHDLADKPWGRP